MRGMANCLIRLWGIRRGRRLFCRALKWAFRLGGAKCVYTTLKFVKLALFLLVYVRTSPIENARFPALTCICPFWRRSIQGKNSSATNRSLFSARRMNKTGSKLSLVEIKKERLKNRSFVCKKNPPVPHFSKRLTRFQQVGVASLRINLSVAITDLAYRSE